MFAKVIAGDVFDVKGPIYTRTPTYYIDFTLSKGTSYKHAIPKGWNAMIYSYRGGKLQVTGNKIVPANSAVVFKKNNQDENIEITTLDKEVRFLLLAG